MLNRRTVLSILGGGTIAAAGAAGWAATRDPAEARTPWQEAGRPADARRRWLSWAILAPNPHNRQPWIADLRQPGEITLLADPDRRLPETDPFDRQITIGLGAFLELARMAAAEEGVQLEVEPFPDGASDQGLDRRPVARLRVVDGTATRDPLFVHAGQRRTNRAAYDIARPVPDTALAQVTAAAAPLLAQAVSDPAEVAVLRDITWRAMLIEMTTPAPARESVDLTRIGRAEIEANPDGISLAGPLIEGLALTGLLSRSAMMDPSSRGFTGMIDSMRPSFETAMAFLWIVTPDNSRTAQLAAGASYLRANLAATAAGIAMQPFSQALQEYREMDASYAELEEQLAPPAGARVQMFARLGFAAVPKGSPRWPLDSRLLS